MSTSLLLTSLITCTTGDAVCTYNETTHYTQVSVCGIIPQKLESEVSPDSVRTFQGVLDGEAYVIEIRPFCSNV